MKAQIIPYHGDILAFSDKIQVSFKSLPPETGLSMVETSVITSGNYWFM